jgi:hypothetical protein
MAKTKVLKAPYRNGSLLHYEADNQRFHWEDASHTVLADAEVMAIPYAERIGAGIRRVVEPPEWRDNVPFQMTLEINSMRSGRSAKYIILTPFEPLDGKEDICFPMFVSDVVEVAMLGRWLPGGVVAGWFMVAKRGQNYGVRLATLEEICDESP